MLSVLLPAVARSLFSNSQSAHEPQKMDLASMRALLGQGGEGAGLSDGKVVDTAETVYISSMALLKMLKHGAVSYHIFREIFVFFQFLTN